MLNFERYSLFWVIGLIAALAIFFVVRAILGYRIVARDAVEDYDFKLQSKMLDTSIPKETYIKVYKRVYSPRIQAYLAGGVITMLVLTPLTIAIYNMVAAKLWINSGRPPIYAPHGFVWAFIMFFGLLGIWATIAFITAQQYHQRAPKGLKEELKKEMR